MRNLLQKLFFNLWYYRKPPWDTGISPPELMEYIANHPPGRALDLGCGTGTNVITLARHGWRVTGVDFARRAIAIARYKARQARIQVDLRVGDVTKFTNPGSFDLVLDIGCFHTLPFALRQEYIHNLTQLLAPQGTYLLYAFFKSEGENGPGLLPADVELLSEHLTLVSRQDGTERGMRPSAWFNFWPNMNAP